MRSLWAAVASDFLTVNAKIEATRKEVGDQIVGLRRADHSVVQSHLGSRPRSNSRRSATTGSFIGS